MGTQVPAEDSVVLNESTFTTDATQATVTVTGCGSFQGGYLILTTGSVSSNNDADSRSRLGSVTFTGPGTYTVPFSNNHVKLISGNTIQAHLYKLDDKDRTYYKYSNAVGITSGSQPAVKPEVSIATDSITADRTAIWMQASFDGALTGTLKLYTYTGETFAEDAAKEAAHIAEKIGRLLDEGVPLTEIAVIYRTNLQGGAFARELYKRGIPYDLRDNSGNVYEHWVAKDLLAYLLLAENEESDSALRRILNKPKRYIGKDLLAEAETMPYTLLRSFFVCPSLKGWQEENLENLRIDLNQIRKRTPYDALKYIRKVIGYDEYLEEFAAYRRTSAQVLQEIADEIMETAKDCADVRSFREQLERLSLQMKEQSRKKGQKRNGVALMTMHGAKGLEFRAVFLPSLVEGIVPHEKGMDTVAEERRLFYVAMTRASEKLCLSAILQRYEKERKPSRFLAEMGLDAEMAFRKNKEKEGNKR